ncbi:MAG: hypothetical protein ACYDCK_02045 [Thermoplasmatota archaeon]
MRIIAIVVASIVALAGLAFAQAPEQHNHTGDGPQMLIVHDGPDDGRALVGDLMHFGFVLADKDGVPIPHHNNEFSVWQNGALLFDTPDAHEYDGIFSFDYVFHNAGPYVVHAWSMVSGAKVEGNFTGTAYDVASLPNATTASLKFTPPAAIAALMPATFTVEVDGPSGPMIDHSDALVEFRRALDDRLVFREHLHAHTDKMAFDFAFPTPGSYTARVIGYLAFPSAKSHPYEAVAKSFPIDVGAPTPGVALAPPTVSALPQRPADAPVAAPDNHTMAMGTDYKLILTTDPTDPLMPGTNGATTIFGPLTTVRLNALIYDPMMRTLVPHVNFDVTLTGPAGSVFASKSLHEYGGAYQLLVSGLDIGQYSVAISASAGSWKKEGMMQFAIAPPVVPLSGGSGAAGPYTVGVAGLDKAAANEPANLTFSVTNPAGLALDHSELEIEAIPPGSALPFAIWKVHTHESGTMNTKIAFPTQGKWTLLVNPNTLEPRPTVTLGPDGPGAPIAFSFTVKPGIALAPASTLAPAESGAATKVPGLDAGVVVLGLGAAAAAFSAVTAARTKPRR